MVRVDERRVSRVWKSAVVALFVFFGAAQMMGGVQYARAVAHTTNILGYQGRLLNSNGVPVADASASMIFELYTAASGGSCVWSNSSATCASATARTVTLTDGLFSEGLGDTAAATPYAAIGDSIFANNAALYLQVTINTEALSPRKQILSAAYALNSQTLDGYSTTTTGGTSAAVTVLDTNGNLQLTGSPQGTGVSQGSVYINPAAGVVAANEVLLGVAVDGSARFTVDGEGDAAVAGGLTVSGGTIDSASAITIASSGGNIAFSPSGSGLAYVTAGDDFAVGGTSLTSPFSVDESTNTVRIGDAADDANDPSIVFYASDATDSGTLSYADSDQFVLTGGNFSHTTLGTLPTVASTMQREHLVSSTWSGTSASSLSLIWMVGLSGYTSYSAVENATSTDHKVAGTEGTLQLSGASTTLTQGYGVLGSISNTATNASMLQSGGVLAGVYGEFTHDVAVTLTAARGVYGAAKVQQGTVTDLYAVSALVDAGSGAATRSYAGYFLNNDEGTTRYGVFAQASGGTANYAGYFTGSAVHIDDDTTPNTAGIATGTGDLYVADGLEVDGAVTLGDGGATDTLSVTSGATTGNALALTVGSLTSGKGMLISRADSVTNFTGALLEISQGDVGSSSTGTALSVANASTGDSIGLYVLQASITDETNGAGGTTTGGQALVLETDEAASNDDIMLVRANGQITLAIESDGSVLSDNAYSSGGADYAEYFRTTDATLQQSEVVCHDRVHANHVERCAAGNTEVVGVITPTPGFIGGLPDYDDTRLNAIVGLTGQIATFATASEGVIAVGDPVTASQTQAGYAALAHGPDRIIGFALEGLSAGTGTIKVYVHPQWYGGDVLASDGSAIVASADVVVDSHDLVVRGGSGAARDMRLRTVGSDTEYRLAAVNNDGTEVAYIGDEGDVALAGRLYPSDRGTLQTSKYIYYDGSGGPGGDMMRTNAAGWSSGSYDFAEMFPSREMLAPGEVVVFAENNEEIRRSTGEAYDDHIAGVVSTSPAFLAGENRVGDVPVALAGRVPTYVSGENGAIAIGDPLTTSTKAGYAMKATEAGPIVGYAMEAFSGNTGVVVAFIRPSYYDGGAVEEAPIAENTASLASNLATLDVSGSLNMNGGSILSVASLTGIGQQWRIEQDGDILTRGRLVQIVKSYGGEDVETYASTSRAQTITLTGTAVLHDGGARIDFEHEDAAFNDVIANDSAYRVYLTPAGITGMLAAVDRTMDGFRIQEAGDSSGVAVDWFVVAYHKDYAPAPQLVVEEPAPEPEVVPEPAVEEVPVADEEPIVDEGEAVDDTEETIVDESLLEVQEEVPQVEAPQEQP